MDAKRGQMISHYRLVEKIGEGGMGVVWKAEDSILNRTVAIKVLPAELALDEKRRRLFLDEARLAASVSHAHIVQVHELGREGELDFIVMEYVEGQPLGRILHGRPLPSEKIADWGQQVAEGLARAHRKGLIHRDLKPANIMVTTDGEVKIVDFGLATLFSRPDFTTESLASTWTETAEKNRTGIAGTLPYMSPEQVRGEKLDSRSDIFSFGTVLYEMTTGQRPFMGPRPADIAQEILRTQPTPVHELVPKVPLALRWIIEKALARRPGDRYQVMEDVGIDLKRLGRDLESGSSPSFEDLQHTVPPKRWSVPRSLFAAGFLATIGLAVWFGWLHDGGKQQGTDSNAATPAPPVNPNWILVADFETSSQDFILATAARELVTTVFQNSEIVTPISRPQVQLGLELAGKAQGTRVVGEIARELAYRAAARTYITGRIDRVGRYSIVLSAVDARNSNVLFSVSDVAANDDALIPVLSRLAEQLLDRIHGRPQGFRANRPVVPVMTKSFEAYQLFVEATDFSVVMTYRTRNHLLERALKLDPDFASAWMSLGAHYSNTGELDAAGAAWEEARRQSDRLTEVQRLRLEGLIALRIEYDVAASLEIFDLLVQREPFNWRHHNDRSVALRDLGRYEDRLDAVTRAYELAPFGPTEIHIANRVESLLELGQYSEAQHHLGSFRNLVVRREYELKLALLTSNWQVAESLATHMLSDATTAGWQFEARVTIEALRGMRGGLDAAARALESMAVKRTCLLSLHLRMLARDELEPPRSQACADTTAIGLLVQGMWAAGCGDTATAQHFLRALANRSVRERRQFEVDSRLLQGWIAAHAGHWEQVIQILEPVESRGRFGETSGRLPIRWLVAEAHERLGHFDQAARTLERVVSPVLIDEDNDPVQHAIFEPFAHQRLVLHYARLRQLEDARRHWQVLQETTTNPDSLLRPMIEEARQALAEAESQP